jgi:hypothetical protein
VPFSYRVVARRADVDAPRLGEVDLTPLVPERVTVPLGVRARRY